MRNIISRIQLYFFTRRMRHYTKRVKVNTNAFQFSYTSPVDDDYLWKD